MIKEVRYCDFCGLSEYDVPYLVESPNGQAHVCGECSLYLGKAAQEREEEYEREKEEQHERA